MAARWLARIDGVSGQVRVFSLGVTALSTFSLVLQNSGHGDLVVPLGVAGLIGVPVYTYAYTEGGVWNQMARDRRDMSNNFAGPNGRIVSELTVRGLTAALTDEPLTDRERELIREELDSAFADLRDGVELPEE